MQTLIIILIDLLALSGLGFIAWFAVNNARDIQFREQMQVNDLCRYYDATGSRETGEITKIHHTQEYVILKTFDGDEIKRQFDEIYRPTV